LWQAEAMAINPARISLLFIAQLSRHLSAGAA
jgi:hypothetical protein